MGRQQAGGESINKKEVIHKFCLQKTRILWIHGIYNGNG